MSLFKKRLLALIGRPDLETLEGIQVIPIPKYTAISGLQSPTGNIEYILQRKATKHKKNGCMDLAIACLRKSNEIMPHSNFTWSATDYLRLVRYLEKDGQLEHAILEMESLKGIFSRKPDQARYYATAASLYEKVGRTEDSQKCALLSRDLTISNYKDLLKEAQKNGAKEEIASLKKIIKEFQ